MAKKRGRPSTYTQAVADAICARLAGGESLYSICKDPDMPGWTTVWQWQQKHEEFANNSARAKERGCDFLAEQCLEIADTPEIGTERTIKPGRKVEVREGDMIQHRRLRIETRMRLIGKWSKRYGDKQQIEHTGKLTLEQLVAESMKPDEPSS